MAKKKVKKKAAYFWSKDEVKLLRKLYPTGTIQEIEDKTGRSLASIRYKANLIGIKRKRDYPACPDWPPDEIKLLLVDPKKVELTGYTKLPHLIAPVITEPHGAYAALSWLVKEMTFRYEILRQLGLRNIHAFNHRTCNKELEDSLSIEIPERMFSIVAIIDEFADLMMVSSSDLETPIARIAQMA